MLNKLICWLFGHRQYMCQTCSQALNKLGTKDRNAPYSSWKCLEGGACMILCDRCEGFLW